MTTNHAPEHFPCIFDTSMEAIKSGEADDQVFEITGWEYRELSEKYLHYIARIRAQEYQRGVIDGRQDKADA